MFWKNTHAPAHTHTHFKREGKKKRKRNSGGFEISLIHHNKGLDQKGRVHPFVFAF